MPSDSYTDFGAFAPSESAYVNPGEYEATQRNVALQKATYLSSMDQFYADLEERSREFDASLEFQKDVETFKEEAWQKEFDENVREFNQQLRLKEAEFSLSEDYFTLAWKAQKQSSTDSMFGNILGGIGGIDMIGGMFGEGGSFGGLFG